jgi:hypothetical protein
MDAEKAGLPDAMFSQKFHFLLLKAKADSIFGYI